jgi:hypothetical protein
VWLSTFVKRLSVFSTRLAGLLLGALNRKLLPERYAPGTMAQTMYK